MDGLLPGQKPKDVWSAWQHCKCGALVWAVSKPLNPEAHLPRYSARVVCRSCGRMHTRHPPIKYQVWWMKNFLKRHVFRPWRRTWRRFWAT